VLLASLLYAGAVITVARALAGVPPLSVAAGSLGVATLLLAPAGLPGLEAPSGAGLAAIAVLGVACTAAAFLAFFHLIALAGPSRAALITYAAPVVAVALGVALRGEPFTAWSGAGVLAVLGGSWLAARRPPDAPAPGAPATPAPRGRRGRRAGRGPARGPAPGRSASG
jgi:drug/metabolite transporter (DMT)-like permease